MNDWLEIELAERLAPVDVPDELWHRIQTGRKIPNRKPLPFMLAAAVLLAGICWLAGPATVRQPAVRPNPPSMQSCALCHI